MKNEVEKLLSGIPEHYEFVRDAVRNRNVDALIQEHDRVSSISWSYDLQTGREEQNRELQHRETDMISYAIRELVAMRTECILQKGENDI